MSQRGKMAVDSSFSKDQKAVVNDARNPRTPRQAFVFFGPFGAAFIIVFLPLVVYALFFLCHQEFCLSWRDLWQIPRLNVKAPFQLSWDVEMWHRFFSLQALGVILGWFAFQVLLYYLIPGKYVPGTKIRDGSRLYYKINGKILFVCGVDRVFEVY